MPLKISPPYQPLLLRILHGLTTFFVIGAIFTALWTYDTYDGRWGQVFLPKNGKIEGIHGTFGLWALLVFPIFALYAFHRGDKRLIQPDFFKRLPQINKSIWWKTLQRLINTLTILALTFAVFSGKMMDENWLPQGELEHGWYYAHLISWLIMVICIALHLLINAKVGGILLLLSIFNIKFRSKDNPILWQQHILKWFQDSPATLKKEWLNLSLPLKILEINVFITIILACLIYFFK
jgi:hypothetical protein